MCSFRPKLRRVCLRTSVVLLCSPFLKDPHEKLHRVNCYIFCAVVRLRHQHVRSRFKPYSSCFRPSRPTRSSSKYAA
ncbi:hypothetical protein PR003_g26957 [Phytophthora rubi]|uniref:Uncharacterized protein n=1 Tax=Phytophthora rubi TaxID=129364 RepID=A0A6A4C6F8_9STRA|nr:hypothetical protein PR001_g27322 [Phytophthora rubi]KAE8975204.1 hypothetical protein PR002_g25662 [Phytophthora rubi]KAE9284052.1 hypothetical protein PR003_g26957 [Phytophthora rubi]